MLSLLCLAALAAAPAAPPPMEALFPKIDGFTLDGKPAKYGPDNLYEYINGAADAFLAYDFEELGAGTYKAADKSEVSVDVYRHRDALRAFGMYTQERPNGSQPLPVGVEGYEGEQHFEFVAGAYYVKLAGKTSLLRGIAEKIAPLLPGTREAPALFKAFPAGGKLLRAEKLATRDFLGHAFLHDGFTVPYEVEGAKFRLFVIEGRDTADAAEMLRKYLAFAKAAPKGLAAEGATTLDDALNGKVDLAWRGRWIWGAVDAPSKARKGLVEQLGKALK